MKTKITITKEYIYTLDDIEELIMKDLESNSNISAYSEVNIIHGFVIPIDESKIIIKEVIEKENER